MNQPGVIDLGMLSSGPAGKDVDQSHTFAAGHRRDRVGRLRGLAITLVGLLCGTLTGAVPEPAPQLTFLMRVPAGEKATVDGNVLYVEDSAGGQSVEVTAYGLPDGTPQWQLTGLEGPGSLDFHGSLMTWSFGAGVASLSGNVVTSAYDRATGELRWSARAGMVATVHADVALVWRFLPAPRGEWPRPVEVSAISAHSGATLWTMPPVAWWGYEASAGSYVVGLDRDGHLTSYDIETGAVLATTGLSSVAVDEVVAVHVTGRMVIVQPADSSAELRAYHGATLVPVWRTTLPVLDATAVTEDNPAAAPWNLTDCLPMLCVYGEYGPAGTYGLDPENGELAWFASGGGRGNASSRGPWSLGPEWPQALLIGESVIDAATGETLLDIQQWQGPHSLDRIPDNANRLSSAAPRQVGSVLAWREPLWRGDRTWFGQLHAHPPRLEVLGSVDAPLLRCLGDRQHVICRYNRELWVWAIRS